jgi:parvulin-like peptidyl-prolyl isomerase
MVVKTSYGWHAIVLTEILPEEVRSVGEAEDEIREQVSQQKRLHQVVAIVQGLEGQGLVHYDQQRVDRLLAMPGLPERAE